MKRIIGVSVVVLVQTLVLVAMIATKQWTLATGTEVALETAPIDPRSLFRGDYVRLNYAISRLSAEEDFTPGDEAYVLLRKGDPYWLFVAVRREPPPVPPDHVLLKGEVRSARGSRIDIRYGIESYFIPEGEGRELERPEPGAEISILIAVDRFGNAGIKAVLVNGEPRYVERLF